MLTVAGHILAPTSSQTPPTFHLANTQPPKLTQKELEERKRLMVDIRHFEKKTSLKPCDTDDRSGPVVSGKRATAGGWVEDGGAGAANPMAMGLKALKTSAPAGRGRGRGGRGGGGGGLGDLFAGGFKPNPGALRGARGGGARGRV